MYTFLGAQEERRRYEELVGRPDAVKALASLYSTIIAKHRSPSLLNEMLLMAQLLGLSPTVTINPIVRMSSSSPTSLMKQKNQKNQKNPENENKKNPEKKEKEKKKKTFSTTPSSSTTLFTTGADCVLFSATVLDELRHRLIHFGARLCRRVMEHPSIHIFVPSLATYIQRVSSLCHL